MTARIASAWLLSLLALPLYAEVDSDQVAKLGKQLTPVGAERAAGASPAGPPVTEAQRKAAAADEFAEQLDPATSVAEWSGKAGGVVEGDAPLFTINAVNVGRYRENLTESHFSLLQTYSNSYFMKVYPSRRTVRWPQEVETATAENATRCSLRNTDDLKECRLGFPFPMPANGAEVIWNHKLRWRGDAVSRTIDQLVVKADGNFQTTRLAEDWDALYANFKEPGTISGELRDMYRYLSRTLEPPRLKGNVVLIHERAGAGTRGRSAWRMTPGTTRARREVKVCCDNPYEGSDGMQFFDQVDMFNGGLERYQWKLLGKRDVFIPYNSSKLAGAAAKPRDFVKPVHINQDFARYELHRVWVVEATLRPGQPHTLRKRRFYVDEDSWMIVAVDMLDNYDQPYQFQEGHLVFSPGSRRPEYAAEIIYHLSTERYFITGLRADLLTARDAAPFPKEHFDAETLKP